MPIRPFYKLLCIATLLFVMGCGGSSDSTPPADTTPPNDTPDTTQPIDQCDEYCTLVTEMCTDDNAIHFGGSTCDMVCPMFPAGEAGANSGNSLACRMTFLTDPTTPASQACAAASPPGGNPDLGFFCADENASFGCLTDEDKQSISAIDPLAVGSQCNTECVEDTSTECFLACASQAANITEGCAECVLNLARCVEQDCGEDCTDDQSAAECQTCLTEKCMDGFNACSGKTTGQPDKCGDGQCDDDEKETCPQDCDNEASCGNGQCDAFESQQDCPADCDPDAGSCVETCGNFQSSAPCHCDPLCEESNNCCTDYWTECKGTAPSCGNGQCEEGEQEQCPEDCSTGPSVCGNGICDENENDLTCPADCETIQSECGNGDCEEDENDQSCPADCKPEESVCGNGECEEDENDEKCPADCDPEAAVCGNGKCDEGESKADCPQDCEN